MNKNMMDRSLDFLQKKNIWEYSSMVENRLLIAEGDTDSISVIPSKYTNTLLGIIRGRKIVLVVADMRNSAVNPKGSENLPIL